MKYIRLLPRLVLFLALGMVQEPAGDAVNNHGVAAVVSFVVVVAGTEFDLGAYPPS